MKESERVQNLLSKLEERMVKGEISQKNYKHLRQKLENKLQILQEKSRESKVSSIETILNEAMEKIVTKVYSCDHCGGILDVKKGASKAKCLFCGYINEIDYLKQISERIRAERTQIIKGAMDSFSKVSNLEQVKLPLHERFIATAHIYEGRALRLEGEFGKIEKYGEGKFEKEKEYFLKIDDKRQYYEASKSWHQVAELYRNASEFAPTSWEMKKDKAASHYYNGLAFFDSSFAPIQLVKNTFYVKLNRPYVSGDQGWPWGENTSKKTCENINDLILSKKFFKGIDNETVDDEIKKYAHPILIKQEAIQTSLLSAIKATNCFLEAYKTSKEEKYLIYALVSKLLTYITYAENLRESIIEPQIMNNIHKICTKELYSPPPKYINEKINERSLKYANSLSSLPKKFALFTISIFKDYLLGCKLEYRKIGYTKILLWEYEILKGFYLFLDNYIGKIDKIYSTKTGSYTLNTEVKEYYSSVFKYLPGQGYDKKTKTQKNVGFNFSWIVGRNKTGLFSYDDPKIYLTIESSLNKKGKISLEEFFTTFFDAFKRLALYPDLITNYLGKDFTKNQEVPITIIGTQDWHFVISSKEYVDLYYSLAISFKKIKSNLSQEFDEELKFIESWKKKLKNLQGTDIPTISITDSQVLSPEFIGYDLDHLSFFADLISTLKTQD
jgi:hypothetical protein